ncbi:hypothetical protein D3C78_1343580 [compost metagenome]
MFHFASYESSEVFASLGFATQGGPKQHDRNESAALCMLHPILFSPGLGMPYQLLVAAVDGWIPMVLGEVEVVIAQKLTAVFLHSQFHQ